MSQKKWIVEIGYSSLDGGLPGKWWAAETAYPEYRAPSGARSEAIAQHRENPFYFIRVRRTDQTSAPIMFYPTPDESDYI